MRKLTVLVLTLIALFFGAEVAARLSEPGPFSWLDRDPYVEDEDLHHALRPNFEGRWNGSWYATNSLGLRGPELPSVGDLDATFTVAALGDGRTFGLRVVEADCWPRQLERALFGELTPSRMPSVANLGVSEYSARDCVQVLKEMGPALDPDVVLVGLTRDALWRVEDFEPFPHGPVLDSLLDEVQQLALGRVARTTLDRFQNDEDVADPADWGDAELSPEANDAIASLVAEARALESRALVFVIPDRYQVEADSDDELSQVVQSACDEAGLLFVDVLTPFRQRAKDPEASDLFLDPDHPSSTGYQIVADTLVRAMRSEGWLQ